MQGNYFLKRYFYVSLTLYITIIVGIFLRLWKLGNTSFWFDESVSFVVTEEAIKKILLSGKFYPPILYTAFIHYWKFIGDSEFMLRLPSVIFGVISIPILYLLGESLFNKMVGLLSAFALAISPFHIYYSREARMYSLISLLTLLSVYFLIKAIRKNKNIYWLGYLISNLVNMYVHPINIFIFVSEILFFLFHIRKYDHLIRKWITIHILVFIFLIPWFISMVSGLGLVISKDDWFFELTFSWIPKITWVNVFYTFKNFAIGYNAIRQIYLFAILIFSILFFWGIFKTKKKEEGLVLSLLCLFTPILFVYLISKFRSCYLDRYFIPSSLFYYLIIGKGLSEINKKYILAVVIGCIIFLSFLALKNYYINYLPGTFEEHIGVQAKKDHKGSASYIAENFLENDVIFHTCCNTIPSFEYYFDKIYKGNLLIKKDLILQFYKNDNKLIPMQYNTIFHKFIEQSQNIDLEQQKRIWLIFSGWDFELAKQPHSPESKITRWMDEHYDRKDSKEFSGIIVYLYVKSINL